MKKPILIRKSTFEEILKYGRAPYFNKFKEIITPLIHHVIGSFAGLIRVEVIHGPTGKLVYDTGWFPNLITNAGLNYIGGGNILSNSLIWFAVGSDNTAPSISDTTLGSQLGNRTSTAGPNNGTLAAGPDFKYWRYRRVVDFGQGAIIGNVNEVGSFTASTSGIMWFRQVLPVTIVLSNPNDNVLRISYDLRNYLGRGDVDAAGYFDPDEYNINVDDNGTPVSTDIESRVVGIENNNHINRVILNSALVAISNGLTESDAMPSLSTNYNTGAALTTTGSYTNNDFFMDRSATAGLAVGNFTTNIGKIDMTFPGLIGVMRASTLSPKVVKDNTRVLIVQQRISWGRRNPDDPT